MVKERLKLTLEELFYNLSDEYGKNFNWRLIPLTQSGRGFFIDELKKEIGKNHFLYNKRVWAVAKCESGNAVLYLTGNEKGEDTYYVFHLTYSEYNSEGSPDYEELKDIDAVSKYMENGLFLANEVS